MTRKFIMVIILLFAIIAISDARLPQIGDHVAIMTSSIILFGNITDITDTMIGLDCSHQKIGDEERNVDRDVAVGIGQIALLFWTTASEEEAVTDFFTDE